MSEDKLQALIETLKKQGLETGEAMGRERVETARKEAEAILAQAKAEAERIVSDAQKEADRQLKRLQSSMEIAASKYVNQLKQQIRERLLLLPVKEGVQAELGDKEFFKKLMSSFVESYASHHPGEALQVRMPLSASDDLVKAALTLLARLGQKEGENQLVIKDPALKMGFMVDLMGGAVRLDFTDEAFIAQFTEQLSPEFWKFFQAVQLQHEDGK